MSLTIQVRINGDQHDVPAGTTITQLLALLDIKAERVAVEVNANVVTRAAHAETSLREGDEIEVVTFVGGG